MPPPYFSSVAVASAFYSVYYCENCKEAIIKALQNTLYLPFAIGGCNSYLKSEHIHRFKATDDMFVNSTFKGNRPKCWKFSNDSRRAFLRQLRTTK